MTLWLRVRIGGQRWKIFLVSPRSKFLIDENGDRLDGLCEYDTCRIFINRDLSEDVFHDTLLHELMHAILHVSGATKFYKDSHKKDECVCGSVAPYLHSVLNEMGVKLPFRDRSAVIPVL